MPVNDPVTRRRQEKLRRSFRPERVQLLFVGESPPASGRFFYQADSGLYRAMRDAFRGADPSIGDESFLAAFKAAGCYLIDLCPDPVDDLAPKPRRRACQAGEPALAKAITSLQPAVIATLLRSIEPNVVRALAEAKWEGRILHLPYPGRWARHRDLFIQTLAPAIEELLRIRPHRRGAAS